MATYTVTTGTSSSPYDFTAAGSRAAADVWNINGGYMRVDCDSRYGFNGTTAGVFGNIVLSATLGGSIEFNTTKVRLIPFSSGSGTVPAADTVIGTAGGASGKLIAVYSALNVAPTAAAAAMPATGFIKVRQWNGTTYANATALTGITATTSGVDEPGWIEIVGVDSSTVAVNRLNQFIVRGDYFTFRGVTTSGTRTTQYQAPTNGSLFYCPGIEVETGVGTGVYEFYPNIGSKTFLIANVATDAIRGKYCWVTTGGLISFGYDGTNSTGGYCPPAGLKIRVPNIFFLNCNATTTANVIPAATVITTRYAFNTSGGGVVDIDKACLGWYMNFTQPYSVALTNTSTFEAITLAECATPIAWSNVGVGQTAAISIATNALNVSLCFAGGTMTDCVWTRAALGTSGYYVTSWVDCSGFTITNEKMLSLTKNGNATSGSSTMTRVVSSTWNNALLGGGRILVVGCTNLKFNNSKYFDDIKQTTLIGTIPMYGWSLETAASINVTIDGLDFAGLTMVQPASGVLNIGVAGCSGVIIRNLGTAASPLNMGGSSVIDATWTRATTTMTVTKVAHGLKATDILAVVQSSDVAPKALTTATASLWTVATAPTADTFTVTVTNSGQTASQYLGYYPCVASCIVNIAGTGYATNPVKIQRCYTPNLRTGIITGSHDNSLKNILLENVWGSDWGVQTVPMLNANLKGIRSTLALAASASVYGTHFVDMYTSQDPTNKAAVAWSRVTTVATVTSANHGLKVGDQILVTVSSDTAAIVLGVKTLTQMTATATPANPSNTFTFTCLNAGGASGTLTFVPINGRVAIEMNEPSADTSAQVSLSNGSAFTSAGTIYMPKVGQSAIWTFPANIKGHASFPIAEAVMGGGTIGNYDISYSLDNAASWHNLYYPRPGGSGTSGQFTFTVTNATGVEIGDYAWGTGIAPNARVTNIVTNTITVNLANTATVSGVIRFNHLPFETVADPLVGFPLKVRITTSTTNSTGISSLYFFTYSSITDRAATYTMDVAPITVSGLVTGSRVKFTKVSDGTVLSNASEVGGVVSFPTNEYVGNIKIEARKATSAPYYQPWETVVTTQANVTTTATALQVLDE